MKTLKKRVLSGAMAGVLAMSLAVPAFASDNTTVVTGTYQDVEIAVDVPTTGVAFINPYGLDLKVKEDATDSSNSNEVTIKGQQIVSAPMAIKNKTGMDLNVNATVTGEVVPLTAQGAVPMKLASNTTKGVGSNPEEEGYVAPATAKSAFVYLQAKAATDTTGTAANVAAEYATWAASAYDSNKDVVVGTRAVTKEGIALLRAADMSGTNGAFAAYKAGSIALFRLAGDCVASPKDDWTEDDSFKATIAFTFAPAQIAKYDITVDSTVTGSGTTAGVTVTSNVATAAEGDTVTITIAGVTAGETATFTVEDADGTAVTVAPPTFTAAVGSTGTTATFVMPAKAVTVSVAIA